MARWLPVLVACFVVAACAEPAGQTRRPVQMGRVYPTPTPAPTAEPQPTPDCGSVPVEIVEWGFERESDTRYAVHGQVRSSCPVAIDVTLAVRFLDGADAPAGPRTFATLRRVTPGEVRPFREVAVGGRGSSRLDLAVEWVRSPPVRRR